MDVSNANVEVTTNEVPAVLADTVSVPTFVILEAVSVRNMRLLAVTAVVEMVAVPATSVPVPAEALDPVVILSLLPAVPRVRLPVDTAAVVVIGYAVPAARNPRSERTVPRSMVLAS